MYLFFNEGADAIRFYSHPLMCQVCIKDFTYDLPMAAVHREGFVRCMILSEIWYGSATLILFEKCEASSSAFS